MALYHSVKGSVNYEVVGTPTIVNGVVRNTGSNSYLQVPAIGSFVNKRIEAVFKYDVNLEATQPSSYSFVWLGGRGSTLFQVAFAANGTGIDVYYNGGHRQFTGITNLLNYKYLKFVKEADNTTTRISFAYEKDNWVQAFLTTAISYAADVSVANQLGRTASAVTVQEAIAVDLNASYIKVDGQVWFGVGPADVQKHQVRGPVGYSVEGNPTIVDGIASGFSNSNSLHISSSIQAGGHIEIVTKIMTTNDTTQQRFIDIDGRRVVRLMTAAATVRFGMYGFNPSGEYKSPTSSVPLRANQFYWCKIVGNSSETTLSYSTDGVNYTTLFTTDLIMLSKATSSIILGGGSSFYLIGSIDLNETYIKVNGKLWYWQPQETKYIVKDGKLVWADPRIYIEDNGTKTYATQDIAPVPAGYTFGSTTTPSIGYVDMRTQQFTAAPSGAVIGRDE